MMMKKKKHKLWGICSLRYLLVGPYQTKTKKIETTSACLIGKQGVVSGNEKRVGGRQLKTAWVYLFIVRLQRESWEMSKNSIKMMKLPEKEYIGIKVGGVGSQGEEGVTCLSVYFYLPVPYLIEREIWRW